MAVSGEGRQGPRVSALRLGDLHARIDAYYQRTGRPLLVLGLSEEAYAAVERIVGRYRKGTLRVLGIVIAPMGHGSPT